MHKYVFVLLTLCLFQAGNGMELKGKEKELYSILGYDKSGSARKADYEALIHFLDTGFEVTQKISFIGAFNNILEQKASDYTCNILMSLKPNGLLTTPTIDSKINEIILSNSLFTPNLTTLKQSHDRILALLISLKKCAPRLPKDMRNLILAHTDDIGNCMILKSLNGEKIPTTFLKKAIYTLYVVTIKKITVPFQKELDDICRAYGHHLMGEIFNTMQALRFEQEFGTLIHHNIARRLQQEKLMPNGIISTIKHSGL